MKKILLTIAIVCITLALLFSYKSRYLPPSVSYNFTASIQKPLVFEHSEAPKAKPGGVVVFDLCHKNNFEVNELNQLYQRIISRNFSIEFVRDCKEFNRSLVNASSLVIVSPRSLFSSEEISAIREFLRKNRSLLLIGDPTRESNISILAINFGIIFNNDYLYNLNENAGNFQYVCASKFKPSNLTKNLSKVCFFVACSISPCQELILVDEGTRSSLETGKAPSPILVKENILAVCDLTFFTPPYNMFYSNNQLISNIADFITN